MTQRAASLDRQRRLLQNLGFGFLEEAPQIAATPAASAPPRAKSAAPPQRPGAPAQRPVAAPAARLDAPPLSRAEREMALAALAAEVRACQQCSLKHIRQNAIPGEGDPEAELLVVIDVPTEADDAAGLPGQGQFRELLDKMLKAMGYERSQVYLSHAVKCATLGGRAPQSAEIRVCRSYLLRQVEIVRPRAIVCFGIEGLDALLPTETRGGMARNRGRWHTLGPIPVMTTFSLGYMLRENKKREVWADLQEVMKRLGRL